jgi:hypothetical protein
VIKPAERAVGGGTVDGVADGRSAGNAVADNVVADGRSAGNAVADNGAADRGVAMRLTVRLVRRVNTW